MAFFGVCSTMSMQVLTAMFLGVLGPFASENLGMDRKLVCCEGHDMVGRYAGALRL